MYSIHPSEKLIELFRNKPYQCQDPRKAKILFLGLDANFCPNIEDDGFFSYIKEYLLEGVRFWNKYGVHHPFLLDACPRGDGVRYHKQFSKLGLSVNHAKHISFVELLDIPTAGRTNKKKLWSLLNLEYLREFDEILLNENPKLLFVSSGVLRVMKKIKKEQRIFKWIPDREIKGANIIHEVYNENSLKVCYMTHFSASISDEHIRNIRGEIDEFLVLND